MRYAGFYLLWLQYTIYQHRCSTCQPLCMCRTMLRISHLIFCFPKFYTMHSCSHFHNAFLWYIACTALYLQKNALQISRHTCAPAAREVTCDWQCKLDTGHWHIMSTVTDTRKSEFMDSQEWTLYIGGSLSQQ